jgi:hypothetical protein
MRSGIKIKDIEIGCGKEAKEDDWAFAEVHFFLNKGEEIDFFEDCPDHQIGINLKSRDFIPGLRYGIVGMREGGTREIKISLHLAYGENGLGDKITPNAVIKCKIKLLKISKDGKEFPNPHIHLWKRQIIVSHRGEATRHLPRWQFGMVDDGEYQIRINYPIPGMTWRHTRNRKYTSKLNKEEMDQIFEEVQNFPRLFPNDVVGYDSVWADMSEPAGNTPREKSTNRLCLSVTYYQEANPYVTFYVTEENQEFQNTVLYKLISTVLRKPELQCVTKKKNASNDE